MNLTIISLNNYETRKLIHESSRTVVYRGVTKADGEPVIIKLMRNSFPSFNELVQFRNQYTIAKNLEIEGIVKPLALERYENGYALIMPDFGGISLAEYYQNLPSETSNISEFLDIAIQVTEIIDKLHKNRIIHKDIKPANILINPQTKQLKIIDFSISTLLPKEIQTIQTPNILEGTLAYISPEQTGRMNRGIDYRSDFYSLGVTFFEMLNGKLPFETTDPMELVHCHLAVLPILGRKEEGRRKKEEGKRKEEGGSVEPTPNSSLEGNLGIKKISDTQIPQMLMDIVVKLMAKNAEDRYQSTLGLKYDLEKCRQEWQEKGEIEDFELGSRDISDRFLIPEKLYGREAEVQTLLDAFVRVASPQEKQISNPPHPPLKGGSHRNPETRFLQETGFLGSNSSDTPSPPLPYSPTPRLLLVAGFSGIGKTAIVNEVHKPIVKQRGYFIKGKFDQFNRNIPFSALVQSFRDLMGQLLSESDTQLQQWKSKILEAVGVQGQVIIEVIPELEKIIGKQPGVPELSGSAAQNRFNLLFGKFIQVFTTKEHPLVIFLDDLQWADSASLNLMKLLMSGVSNSYLLMIGAYRDNEVFPAHPLMLTLDEMAKAGVIINTITLAPLSEDNINCLVADTLSCNREVAKPLTELIYQKTKGNPFFTTQFLLGLYKNKLISFNNDVRYWECDIVEVRQQTLTDDVVEFMAQRLQKLPAETQEVLKLAACIGNHFDLATLAIVYEQSQGDTATALWKALQEEFILPQSEVYKFYLGEELQELSEHREQSSQVVNYKFLHDRVQQGAYSLIPEDQKQATHLKIGELLLNNTPNTELDENLFEIVNQLNIGRYLVVELPKQIQIAELNLKVAQKARAATAYAAAYQYAVIGIDLLNSPHLKHSPWQTYYDLTLPIHELATETAYLNGDITCMEKWAKIVLQEAKNVVDKMGIYATKIQAYMGQAKKLDALKIGLEALELLDVNFPSSPSSADIEQALTQTASNLQGKEIKDLINLPMMTDVEKLAIAKMLTSIGPPSFQAARSLFPLVICKSVNLSLKYGNSPFSGYGYACYGIFLNAIFQDPDSAYKFGQLALKLSQCFNAPDMKSSVFMAVGVCTIHIKVHVKETLSILQEGYQSGLEGGNFEFPAYCAVNKCHYLYFLGQELSSLERDMETINDALVKFKQDNALAWNQTFQQSIINLRSLSKNPCNLEGEVYNEKTSLPQLQEADRRSEIFYVYINKLILSYLFEDYQLAQENALKAEQYLDAVDGILVTISFNFYDSLAHLAVGLFVFNQSQLEQILNRVNKNQEKMKQWATHAPMNFQHKYDLVEAEKSHIMGNNLEAIDLYDCAIAGARENEYIQEEALANELAAKFYLKWGKEKVAAGYMQEAYYCYARWGAKAKTDDLEKCYPNLLSPILKPAAQTLDPLETLSTFSKRSVTNHSSTTSLNSALDFTTVLKAAQAISGIIELDELLRQLTHIILQHSGGNRCALILPNSNGEWLVQAIATPESTEICYEPLENNPNLPTELIQYVKNTQETVVINDLKTDLPIIDRYLLQKKPKSVLCLPILNQGHLIGILYLKNFLVSGAFTRERVVVLNFLCTQAAIALENARLYEQSQAYAQKLEQSQLQIVQYEKMASLGNLMAGVAHEINNPLGFLNGSISNAQENLHDIMQHFQLYHKYYPDTVQAIAENAEEIDLDYLCEDMPKLLSSMKNATERIKNLSTSLRTFSRADTEHQLIADIHQGIDSTLMILKYRLKANQERPEIQVIKDYGDFSEVECFPGQLNQVFMNIIANAIDMFDEVAQSLSYSEIEAQPQKITIKTALLTKKNVVKIIIEDNGKGMTPEVKARIFDHLFTTKGVGKGTGLGLAIVRQIVVEKHGGTIDCISELGKGTKFIITLPLSMVC